MRGGVGQLVFWQFYFFVVDFPRFFDLCYMSSNFVNPTLLPLFFSSPYERHVDDELKHNIAVVFD
mgnify:FL=1